MAKRKLKKAKVTLAGGGKIHDRLAKDLPTNAKVAPIVVDDPHAIEVGEKIVVLRSLRDDPLGRMHDRGQVDQAQYTAGRYWQAAYEVAEVGGVRAIDPTREPVDGGQIASATISDAQARAFQTLAKGSRAVGMLGESVLRDVLVHGMFPEQVAAARGFANQRSVDFYARLFRECLEVLAVAYGFAGNSGQKRRVRIHDEVQVGSRSQATGQQRLRSSSA